MKGIKKTLFVLTTCLILTACNNLKPSTSTGGDSTISATSSDNQSIIESVSINKTTNSSIGGNSSSNNDIQILDYYDDEGYELISEIYEVEVPKFPALNCYDYMYNFDDDDFVFYFISFTKEAEFTSYLAKLRTLYEEYEEPKADYSGDL